MSSRLAWLVFMIGLVLLAASFSLGRSLFPSPMREVVTVKEAAPAAGVATAGAHGYRQAARKAMPSVVNIYTLKQRAPQRGSDPGSPFGHFPGAPEAAPATSLGSGVIVSSDGYILTNNHVVEGAEEIAVAFRSGETTQARIVGLDPETDLAVLKVNAKGLVPITFADPAGIELGDPVLAIGNPFGVGQAVTQGIVSATGRNRLGINTFENFIQTDAAINPGNSGGALVDAAGDLIGINTAIYSESGGSQGIGFAIPAQLAREVLEQILKTGRVERGWLGIDARDLRPANGAASDAGIVIAGVLRGGPADAAGIRPGDVMVAINRRPVRDTVGLINEIAAVAPGNAVEVTLLRAGRQKSFSVVAGKRPPLRRADG